MRVLSDTESTESDVQNAFNSLATSISDVALTGTEDFRTLKAALEDLGVVNNELVAFDHLISNTEALKQVGLDLADASYEQIQAFAAEYISAENLSQAINMLTQQKMLNALQDMDTSKEVANMISLAKSAGVTADVIAHLTELEKIYQEVASGTLSEHMLSQKLARADELKRQIENGITKVDYTPKIDFSPAIKSAASSASSAAESFTDLLDKELAVLDKKMEAGYIEFNDYIKARLDLIEDYYKKGKISADEYYSYLEKHYDTQLSYMDKAVNAVTRRLDKEIDSLSKQKDDIEDYYNLQIESLEKQKTLLEEANRERERQLNLQKALYEFERARNQRTILQYSESKGMHYVADEDAIRDTQKDVEDAEFEIKIAEIEKSISKLEEARDRETDAIDEMIDKLEEYRDKWDDITSAYEEQQEDLIAAQLLGQDWEQQILDGRLDTLNKFKDDYIAIQQAMVDAAYQAAQAMANAQNVTIGDSSAGKMSSANSGGEHGWEVVDESTASTVRKFGTEKEAKAYSENLNAKKAASYGMTVRQFNNSDIPGYYVKKYHTGLQQGLVDQHSFDEDFELVQKVGLGEKEVPAILKEGEAVATPSQISNIANELRHKSNSGLPDNLVPLPDNHPISIATKMFETMMNNGMTPIINPALTKITDDISKTVNTLNNINNSKMQNIDVGGIHITCPGVTSQEVAKQVGAEVNNLFNGLYLSALQESKKR